MFEGAPEHYALAPAAGSPTRGWRRPASGVIPDAAHNPISADTAARRAGTAHLDWLLDCADALGAEVLCGPVPPAARRLHRPRPDRGRARRGSSRRTRRMADRAPRAHARGRAAEPVRVLRADHQRPGGGARRAGRAAELRLPLRHLPLQHRGERPGGVADRDTSRAIRHIHISENHRGAPGTGHIDHAAAIRAARDAGYDGWFTVEAFGQALPDLAAATQVWRPLFESEDQVVKAGARVIRAGWAS